MDILHPTQTRFPCLLCNTFPILGLLTRHFTKSHPKYTLAMHFCCAVCNYTHSSKRSIGCHFRSHGVTAAPIHMAEADDFVFPHCAVHLPSKNSCSQHIRAQHMMEACAARATANADDGKRRLWDATEIEAFEDAVKRVGPDSNIKIASIVGTRTAKQVGAFMWSYFADHPEWVDNNFRPSSPSHPPSLSCSDSVLLPDISSPPHQGNVSLHAEATPLYIWSPPAIPIDVLSPPHQGNVSLHAEATPPYISSPPATPINVSSPPRQGNVSLHTEATPPYILSPPATPMRPRPHPVKAMFPLPTRSRHLLSTSRPHLARKLFPPAPSRRLLCPPCPH